MNLDHLRAFVWLRWRLFANQVYKGSMLNKVLLIFFGVSAIIGSIGLFIGGFTVGLLAFLAVDIPTWVMLVVWDGLIVVVLIAWSIGVLSELQRSEALSVDKFLHLPVSLAGIFVLNYLSSLLSLTLIGFLPMLLGFSLGLVISKGPAMLLLFPLLAAFFLMVTALTYQFQGWLATLMVNKRRRRTIIVFITCAFVLLMNLPNLANVYFQPWKIDSPDELHQEQARINLALANKEIELDEFQRQMNAAPEKFARQKKERDEQIGRYALQTAWIVNAVLPPGWLALGAWNASEGDVLPAIMGIAGMGLIGAASLRRSYHTTLRFYTGQYTSGAKATAPAVAAVPKKPGQPPSATLLERNITWLSEPAAVIALATFRSLTRAPEAKMLLVTPLFMVCGIAAFFMKSQFDIPEALRPLIVLGSMVSISLVSLVQLVSNQFGYDRTGFKIYVLSPAARRDILLGKNLAILPLMVVLTAPVVAVIAFLAPMPIGYLLAMPFEFVSMFLLVCLVANVVSILAPMPMASGTLKPVSPKMVPMLMHMAGMMASGLLVMPVLLLPWGIEAGLTALEVVDGIPICLALSALECIAIIVLYRSVLTLQGQLLQNRELTILETVTTKAE